jgi:GH15 family glucan-1,4-alpha-glucosidase
VSDLSLALIGNSGIGALVDPKGEIVWGCFPRFDGDAMFCSLLREAPQEDDAGFWAIDLLDCVRIEQVYVPNTPVLVTRLYDRQGGAVEITDFAPRFRQYGRIFCPMMLVRRVRRLSGSPRIRVRLRPAHSWGAQRATVTYGSNHIRYVTPGLVLRLTTDASITALLQEAPFSSSRIT